MFKVRFHLKTGKNFMKWQVKEGRKAQYYKPDDVQLVLANCKLRNQPKTAQKICDGSFKTVCAWVECENVQVLEKSKIEVAQEQILQYNPKIKPFWRNANEEKIDNQRYATICSVGNKLFTI